MRPRIYVSGPLSSSGDRAKNVHQAIDAGLELARAGYAPLIPHLTHYADPHDSLGHDVWIDIDLPWVAVADALVRLPGESVGADAEVAEARRVGIPVFETVWEAILGIGALMLQARHPSSARFYKILDELAALHARKQQDYGRADDPFANVRASQEWGMPAWIGAMVRASDKVRRLQAFATTGQLANEGALDSFDDLAVYAVIARVLFEEEVARPASEYAVKRPSSESRVRRPISEASG